MSAGTFGVYLNEGFDKTPGEVVGRLRRRRDGSPGSTGWTCPTWRTWTARSSAAWCTRRRGGAVTGRDLLRHGAERAAANGRSMLEGVRPSPAAAGEAFARAVGAKPALVGGPPHPVPRQDRAGRRSPGCARRRSGPRPGTRWCRWTGDDPRGVPGGRWRGVQRVQRRAARRGGRGGGLGRAPGSGSAPGPCSGRADARLRHRGAARRHRRDGGLHRGDRRPGGTRVGIPAAHRRDPGHIAGTGSGCWSRPPCWSCWPPRNRSSSGSSTGNAAANAHMIAVNEQLGYEVVRARLELTTRSPVARLALGPSRRSAQS